MLSFDVTQEKIFFKNLVVFYLQITQLSYSETELGIVCFVHERTWSLIAAELRYIKILQGIQTNV